MASPKWQQIAAAMRGSDDFAGGVLMPANRVIEDSRLVSVYFERGATPLSTMGRLSLIAMDRSHGALRQLADRASRAAIITQSGIIRKWYTGFLLTELAVTKGLTADKADSATPRLQVIWDNTKQVISESKHVSAAWLPNDLLAVEMDARSLLKLRTVALSLRPPTDVVDDFKETAALLRSTVDNHPDFARALRALFKPNEYNPLADIAEYALMRSVNGKSTEDNLSFLSKFARHWVQLERLMFAESDEVPKFEKEAMRATQAVFSDELIPMSDAIYGKDTMMAKSDWRVSLAVTFQLDSKGESKGDAKGGVADVKTVTSKAAAAHAFSRMAGVWYDPSRSIEANWAAFAAMNKSSTALRSPDGFSVDATLLNVSRMSATDTEKRLGFRLTNVGAAAGGAGSGSGAAAAV